MFVDTSNVLVANQSYNTYPKVFTAPEDCFMTFRTNYNNDTSVYIDNVLIEQAKNQQNHNQRFFLKKGQTLRLYESGGTTQANINAVYAFGLK